MEILVRALVCSLIFVSLPVSGMAQQETLNDTIEYIRKTFLGEGVFL